MSDLCDYSAAHILVSGTITITGEGDDHAAKRAAERNKGVIFENCAPFTACIGTINNNQIDQAQYIDVVIPMYNLKELFNSIRKFMAILYRRGK